MSTLWRNWSSGQRFSVSVIVLAVLVSLALSYTAGTTESWQVLPGIRLGRNSDEFNELISSLDSEGIPWRFSQKTETSRFEIEVSSRADYRKALLLASENGLVEGDREEDLGGGLFGVGLTDTAEKARWGREENQIRKVERQVRGYPGISSIDLIIKHGKPGRFATDQDTPDTAVVLLRLKDSFTYLPPGIAEGVRKVVNGAFSIEAGNIQIVDNNGRGYPGGSAGFDGALARDLREEVHSDISSFIAGLYLGVFEKEQFRLGVFVDSPPVEAVQETGSAPGAQSPVEEGAGADPALAREAQQPGEPGREPVPDLQPPPGSRQELLKEKYRVQVNLVLDITAVKEHMARLEQVLESEGTPGSSAGLAGRIEIYERQQEERLARLLPYENVRVMVNTEAFSKPQAQAAAAPPFFTGLLARGWDFAWFSDPYIYGGGGALLLALLVSCLLRIRARRKRRLESEAADAIRSEACRDTLDAVDQAGSLVRSSPETSTAVVKMWLSESPQEVVEMSGSVGAGAES